MYVDDFAAPQLHCQHEVFSFSSWHMSFQLFIMAYDPCAEEDSPTPRKCVFAVTDGEPSDKPPDKIFSVIRECVEQCTRLGYGPHAVAFQFAQVGCPKDCWEGAAQSKCVCGIIISPSPLQVPPTHPPEIILVWRVVCVRGRRVMPSLKCSPR